MKTYIIKKEQSPIPVIPGEWNYEESIKRLQPLVYKWKNLTIEVAQELYVAREMLANQGARVDLGTNVPKLTWDGYCQSVGIEKRTANRWLSQFFPAEQKVTALAKTDEMCAIEDLESLIDSGKRYSTILADPPWAYSNQATRAATDNHYETMPLDDICALPITDIVSDNAHLHLWTTNAFLFDAKRVMESWGFEYKSVFIWIKPSMGIGNYWRVSHEFMLFGIRGSLPFQDHSEMSWLSEKRSVHSKKPVSIIEKIEKVSPGPYLELFGRNTRQGWTVWGNEIKRDLFNESAFNA